MGYGLQGYTIQLDELERKFVSWDERVFEQVSTSYRDILDRYNEDFEYEIKEWGCPNSYKCLDEIIMRKIKYRKNGFLYCYVFELICRSLGHKLNNSELYPLGGSKYIDFLDNWAKPPFGIPLADDFPIVYTIYENDFEDLKVKTSLSKLEDNEKKQFISWVDEAKESKSELILYYY
ncbi:MAG: hypothetical protein KDK36_00865 [Leptospiraceae bacterium]|nr:hypothetical protein [Leptospiraceae bacterium]